MKTFRHRFTHIFNPKNWSSLNFDNCVLLLTYANVSVNPYSTLDKIANDTTVEPELYSTIVSVSGFLCCLRRFKARIDVNIRHTDNIMPIALTG